MTTENLCKDIAYKPGQIATCPECHTDEKTMPTHYITCGRCHYAKKETT